jgi:uncharacterized iron-regulated membrane protein
MTRSVLARLRRLWLDVHLWIGAGLMIALVPLSVSGALLVFHDELDRALHAERYAVSGTEAALPAQAYAAAAQGAFGQRAQLSQLRLPGKAGDPVVAVGRLAGPPGAGGRPRSLNAWIDPPTGRVLAVGEVAQGFTMWLHRLHGSLLIPGFGRKVVGWLGWAMFASCATGLWLWWPRHAGFAKGLRWRRGASTLFNLHHLVGFWVCLPLAILSLTGVYISFPQTSRALFGVAQTQPGRPATGRPDARFAPPLAQPATALEDAVAAALETAPGAAISAINLPLQGGKPAWRIELARPGAAGPIQVRVDDASGKASLARAQAGGGPDPLSRWMRRIHDGTDLGAWRGAIFLAGLAPAILGVTGLVMWLRRRARRLALQALAAAE